MLGQLLGSGAPESSMRPQRNPLGEAVAGQQPTQREGFLSRILSDPVRGAMWMQIAAGLLASRGLGPSVSQGLGAAGRAAETQAQMANQMEAEMQRRAAAASAARGGGGGSGSTQEGVVQPGNIEQLLNSEEFKEARQNLFETLTEDVDWGNKTFEERMGYANILAMEQFGISDGADIFRRATPEQQAVLAQGFMNPLDAVTRIRVQSQANVEAGTTEPQQDSRITSTPGMTPATPIPGFTGVGGIMPPMPPVLPSPPARRTPNEGVEILPPNELLMEALGLEFNPTEPRGQRGGRQ